MRRRGKVRSRVLYWFRTPPGVKVGRAAIDEDAIRHIEASHPDIDFDWTRILNGEETPEPPATDERRSTERPAGAGRSRADRESDAIHRPAGRERLAAEPVAAVPAEVVPLAAQPPDEPLNAAHARLGAQGLARLRGRYAELLARIAERVAEPDRQGELKSLAERLNPDSWVTDDDVRSALDSYEPAFEALRTALGPRRQRKDAEPGDLPGSNDTSR